MKIVVTVKLVPDTNADKRFDPATKRLMRAGTDTVINPFDEYAIEAALKLKEALADGSTVTIFSMAPASGKEIVRKALAMGADDAVMLSDEGLAGSDVWGTASVTAQALRSVGFDLIVCGTQSTDAGTGEFPGMLAEYLGIPGLTYLRAVEIADGMVRGKRETDTGFQSVRVKPPALISVTKSANEPRYPSLKGIMGAKKKEIRTLSLADLTPAAAAGGDGAKARIIDVTTPPARAKGRVVQAPDAAEGARAIFDFLKEKKLV